MAILTNILLWTNVKLLKIVDERSSRLGDLSGHKKRLPITLVQIITNFNTLIWLVNYS